MLLPTKHQDLNNNILVIGADILHLLKHEKYTLEEMFQRTNVECNISLEVYFDTLTFLWLINAIEVSNNIISKYNVSN